MKDGSAFSSGFRSWMFPACPVTPSSSTACTTVPGGFWYHSHCWSYGPQHQSLGMKPAYTVKTLNMFGGQFGAGNVYNKTGGLLV